MLSWFTSKSVERTNELMANQFGVYDLTFLEWEQKEVIEQQQRVYICAEKAKKNQLNRKFEVLYKRDTLLIFSLFRDINRQNVEEVYNSVKTMLNSMSDGITSKKPIIIAAILKDIVESTRAHPKWTSAHIAAKAGLEQLFTKKTSDIMASLNSQSKPDLSTPLHLAIESGRVVPTKALLALRPKLDLKDEFENTSIHLAAMSDKEILLLLLKERNALEMLKWINKKGCTPLHLACFAQKYDNVIQLLEFGLTVKMMTVSDPKRIVKDNKDCDKIIHFKKADIEDLDTQDMEFGGTPLHWVKHRRALERLIGYGFDLNVRNGLGETALHTMVKRMRLKCMIGLLCFGAKVNKKDKLGESPLHCAVRTADVTSSQALIVFDAKINARNKKQQTARHIAAQTEHMDHHMVLWLLSAIGAERCPSGMNECKSGCAVNGNYEGKPYHRWPTYENEFFYKSVLLEHVVREALNKRQDKTSIKPNGVRMMCLDGGGVRGLITIQLLIEMEKRLNKPINTFFDWISGTSTGSILALLVASGRPLPEMRAIYFRFKDKILTGSRPYSSKNFETLLEEEIGSDFRMSDVKKNFNKNLIINAILIDQNPAKLHLFRSYESPEEILGLPEALPGFKVQPNHREQLAWRACRASGAAPTYFRASGSFLDGGLVANNPTLDALTEFKIYNNSLKAVGRDAETQELDLIISFGTGKFAITPAEPVDIVRLWSFSIKEMRKNTLYMKQMGSLLINLVTATEGHVIDRCQAWCSCLNTPYFRVNPVLSEVISLDETSDVEICNALWETKAYMYAMKDKVDDIIRLLLPPVESLQKSTQPLTKGLKTGYTVNLSQNEVQITSEPITQSNESDKN